MIKERNEVLDRLKENLHKAQARMNKMAKKRMEVDFKVGNHVFFKL